MHAGTSPRTALGNHITLAPLALGALLGAVLLLGTLIGTALDVVARAHPVAVTPATPSSRRPS